MKILGKEIAKTAFISRVWSSLQFTNRQNPFVGANPNNLDISKDHPMYKAIIPNYLYINCVEAQLSKKTAVRISTFCQYS